MSKAFKRIILLVLLVVGLLTACQKSSEPKEEKKESADGGKGTLKVIAAYDAKEKVFEEFTKKTGIKSGILRYIFRRSFIQTERTER